MTSYDEDPERAKRFTWNDGDVEVVKEADIKIIPPGGLKLPDDYDPDDDEEEDVEGDE